MYQTILVPLDGSRFAERALPFAQMLATPIGARLILIRAALIRPWHGGQPQANYVEAMEEAEAYLADVKGRLDPSVTVETSAFYGEAAEAILAAVAERKGDLVVMSTHGHSGPGRWVYGTVADRVMRRAEVPILLVPASCVEAWSGEGRFRILVPLDGSGLAEEVLAPANDLVEVFRAETILLRVIDPVRDASVWAQWQAGLPLDPTALLYSARQYLERIADGWRAAGRAVVVHSAVGPVASAIDTVARQQHVSVIAMTTHGRSGRICSVMSNVTTSVVQRANVPILLVRPTIVRRAQPGPGAREPGTGMEGMPISLMLTPRELLLLANSLENTVLAAAHAGHETREIQDLLARIKNAESLCQSEPA
jgi:nucleotide-binding universal stress UspA family protein